MWTSVKMTVLAVVLSLVFGTLFAILLDRKFLGRGLVRTLLITPFLLMPVVVGLIWKNQMFNDLYGVINWVIDKLGGTPVDLVSRHPTTAIALTLIWQWTPFMELGVLLGTIYLIQVYDLVAVMTGGGSGSTNVPYFVFQKSIGGGWDFGQASSYSIVVVVASIIIATIALRVLSGLLKGEEIA